MQSLNFFGLEGQAEGQIAAEGSWDSRLPCELVMIFFLFPLDSRSLTEGVTSVVTTQPCFSARGQVPQQPTSPHSLSPLPQRLVAEEAGNAASFSFAFCLLFRMEASLLP